MEVSVIIKDVEVDAKKVLGYLARAQKATPKAAAGLAVVLGAVSKAITDGQGAAGAAGLNIALDVQTASDVKAVWPEIKDFAADLGIKL